MSAKVVGAAIATLLGAAASVVGILTYFNSQTPGFTATLDSAEKAASLTRFLAAHDGKHVHLQVDCAEGPGPGWCFGQRPPLQTPEAVDAVLEVFTGTQCPTDGTCAGTYWIGMAHADSYLYNYAGAGTYRLKGDFTERVIEAGAGIGIPVPQVILTPVSAGSGQ